VNGPDGQRSDTATKPARVMSLRRAGSCASCGVALPAGSKARWDPAPRTTTCLACCDAVSEAGEPVTVTTATVEGSSIAEPDTRLAVIPVSPPPPAQDESPVAEAGNAGGSAQREYERRKGRREARVRERHPRLGGLILALSDEPQPTTAWAKGAEGERRVAQMLDTLRSESVIVLHDRRIPRSKANIDHLVITSSGIHVIDAKRYKGRVEIRGSGTIFRPGPNLLFVGGRNKTSLVEAMTKQVAVVQAVIADLLGEALGSEGPVIRPALCFVDAEWSWFAKPMMLDGVRISGPKSLTREIAEPGPLTIDRVLQLGTRIAERLPPA
jgi:hypothetical protein